MSRRNDIDICADILRTARSGVNKTRIVYNANLNFNMIEKYIRRLVDNGLLQLDEDRTFLTTKKGAQFLRRYEKLGGSINWKRVQGVNS